MDYYVIYCDWRPFLDRLNQYPTEGPADEEFFTGVLHSGPEAWYDSSRAYQEAAETLLEIEDDLPDWVRYAAENSAMLLISEGLCDICDALDVPGDPMNHEGWFMILSPDRVAKINQHFIDFQIEECEEPSEEVVFYVNMWKSAVADAAAQGWGMIGKWG